ncbi:hypothetical protein KSF_096140 [Reticulibacter mediterranei]|uniref:Uncharacterized protein n=1 Tax=Reticulibacter mediterranei TaxID=2778369 RepID=A0A8J3IRR3_9CHLR|nr:hypothetical protein [Reticulibacter mediterranei]GHO99566.1 hypothetical protein KSF_096140 [Reticulibacter mediterranei]
MAAIPGLGLGHPIIYVDAEEQKHAAVISEIVDAEAGKIHLHQFVVSEKKPVHVVRNVQIDISASPVPRSWHWPPRNV